MGYNDPVPKVTPEERERNLNKTPTEIWTEAEESAMDKGLETLRKVNAGEAAAKRDAEQNPP